MWGSLAKIFGPMLIQKFMGNDSGASDALLKQLQEEATRKNLSSISSAFQGAATEAGQNLGKAGLGSTGLAESVPVGIREKEGEALSNAINQGHTQAQQMMMQLLGQRQGSGVWGQITGQGIAELGKEIGTGKFDFNPFNNNSGSGNGILV